MIFWWHSPIKPDNPDLGARMTEIFFVLSGFLVGVNHWNDEYPDIFQSSKNYWKSKLIKIWPIHCIAFIIDCASSIIQLGSAFITQENAINAVINLSLLQAWSNNSALYFSFNGATWFLSALLFCYLLTPIAIDHLRRYKWTIIPFIIAISLRLLLELLNCKWGWNGISFNYHVSPIIRMIEFIAGLSLFPIYNKIQVMLNEKKHLFFLLSLLEILAITAYIFSIITYDVIWIRGYYILAACILVLALSFNKGIVCRILSMKPFIWFSSIQLEFYILHQAIKHLFQRCFPNAISSPLLLSIIMFLITIGLAILYKKLMRRKATRVLESMTTYIGKLFRE